MLSNQATHADGPIRTLHLVHGLNFGGVENWVLAVLRHVPRSTFIMDVCYKGPVEGGLAAEARSAGALVVPCRLGPAVVRFVRRLRQILVDGRYSLLHVHTHAHSGPAVYAARAVGVPVVTTFHSTERRPQTPFTRFPVVRMAREVYARRSVRYALQNSAVSNGVSAAVADAVTEAAGLTRNHCDVFYLGCERPRPLSRERIEDYQRELRLVNASPVVIHVGSFRACKNHDGLLRSFRMIVDAVPDAVLLLVGDGPLRGVIEQRIQNLNLVSNVRLLGLRHDATALLQLGDLFLFPSHYEGLSVALMEANAVGLPVVGSNIPGNREATDAGSAARLHDPADFVGMAASGIELLRDSTEARRLGTLANAFYDRVFSIEASVDRLMSLYAHVLETRHGIGPSRFAA